MSSHSRRLTAQFKITTPMFLAGADQQEVLTSIRPPSIKGALRFWWRALNWARVRALHSSDKAALQQLHKEEGKLFGGAHIHGRDDQGKEVVRAEQSRVALRVKDQIIKQDEELKIHVSRSQNLRYLLGMGLYDRGLTRPACHGSFCLDLYLSPSATEEQFQQLEDTLLCFGLLGALGSRARHGWGSISIQSLKRNDEEERPIPNNRQEYQLHVKRLLQLCGKVTIEPPFSAFCGQSRIDISAQSNNNWSLLTMFGEEQQRYRTRNQSVGELEENFNDDRDLAYRIARGNRVDTHPRRIVLGLPHHYNLQGAENVQCDVTPVGKTKYRRASPLFAHIHRFPNSNEYLLVQTLLQSCFLPSELKVEMRLSKDKEGRNSSVVSAEEDWQVIHEFMDRFSERETLYGH